MKTRMHSSGIRTVRSSSRLSQGAGSASVHAGIPAPSWEQTPLEQTPLPDQAPPGDLLQGMLGYHPPPGVQTHTCKNIIFATSLRTVKTFRENSRL